MSEWLKALEVKEVVKPKKERKKCSGGSKGKAPQSSSSASLSRDIVGIVDGTGAKPEIGGSNPPQSTTTLTPQVLYKVYELYKSYKSRWSYNPEPKKNRRTRPKQALISSINAFFKFESEKEERK